MNTFNLPARSIVYVQDVYCGWCWGFAERMVEFEAAKRPTPIIVMGNREDELKWWKEQKDANKYETMSVSIAPGVSTLAFWVAQQILDGKEVKKDLVVPFLRIDQDNLEANLANTQAGGVANVEYSLEDAQKVIGSAM